MVSISFHVRIRYAGSLCVPKFKPFLATALRGRGNGRYIHNGRPLQLAFDEITSV